MAQKLERSPCMIPSNVGTRPLNSGTRIVLDYYPEHSLIDFNPFLQGRFEGTLILDYGGLSDKPIIWEDLGDYTRYYFTLPQFFYAFSTYDLEKIVDFFELHLADSLDEEKIDEFSQSALLLEQLKGLGKLRQAGLDYGYLEALNFPQDELDQIVREFPSRLKRKRSQKDRENNRTCLYFGPYDSDFGANYREISQTLLSQKYPILMRGWNARGPQDLTDPFNFLRYYWELPTDHLKITKA
jgi:hypothetical protein